MRLASSNCPRITAREIGRTVICLLTLISLLLTGCKDDLSSPARTVTPGMFRQPTLSATRTPAAPIVTTLAAETPVSTVALPVPTFSETPAFTPDPLLPYTISGLQQREFPGGEIEVQTILKQNNAFTQYYISYPSDGLTITGLMYMPPVEGPLPTLILLHGYIDRDRYFAGADTWQVAEFFVRQGYLVLAPDLRSWGGSDTGLSLFHTGLVVDVLNLISSLPTLPQADPQTVGLWGHSMGGGIVTKVLTVDDRVRAAILYAPNSADDADLIARWGAGCLPGQSQAAGDHCNPAEIIPPNTAPDLIEAYLAAAANPDFLQRVAPIHHLQSVSAPVQIHIGTADGQSLVETPVEWSAKLHEALQAASQDVSYFTYDGQGHSFTGESWTTLLQRALSFFNTQLKGDA